MTGTHQENVMTKDKSGQKGHNQKPAPQIGRMFTEDKIEPAPTAYIQQEVITEP